VTLAKTAPFGNVITNNASQFLQLGGAPGYTTGGGISQTIATTPGYIYNVSIDVVARSATPASGTFHFGSQSQSLTASSLARFQTVTCQFTATDASTVIDITGDPASASHQLIIDNVFVAQGAGTPPSITGQPQSRTNAVGTMASFSVTAGGLAPFSYQWYFNTNTALTAATNSLLVLNDLQATSAGTYSVVVSNSINSATSSIATLTLVTNLTVQNWNFELPGFNANFPAGDAGGLPGWIVNVAPSDGVRVGTAAFFGGAIGNNSSRFLDLSGGPGEVFANGGGIHQTLGTTPGATYGVCIDVAARLSAPAQGTFNFAGQSLSLTAPSTSAFTTLAFSVVATNALTVIDIAGDPLSSSQQLLIDNVRVLPMPTWQGNIDGTWDIGTTANWTALGAAATYADASPVLFDDTATGATSLSNSVTVSPGGVFVNNTNKNYTIGGMPIAGIGGLNKSGPATLTLRDSNSYTGPTTVNGGTLEVDGSLGAGTVTVAANATLSGLGTIGGSVSVQNGGRVAPGGSVVGALTTGAQTWNAGSVVVCKLAGITDDSASRDSLTINGTLDLSQLGNGGVATLKLVSMLDGSTPGNIPGFDPAGNYTWTIGSATGLNPLDPNVVTNIVIDPSAVSNAHPGTFSLAANVFASPPSLELQYTGAAAQPVVSLDAPTVGAVYGAYGTVALAATVQTNGYTISSVEFLTNGTMVASAASPPYAADWMLAAPGSYTITARALYNATSVDSTNSAGITVNRVVTPHLSALTRSGSAFSFTVTGTNGQHYTLLSSTNVAASLATWTTNQQGLFIGNSLTYTNTPVDTKRFFDVRTP
jgi:autotransporter-associated beta strand protein